MKSKEELRARYLQARKQLSIEDVEKNSRQIMERVIQLDEYINADRIHCYVPIQKNREADTTFLIHHALDHGKKVFVPVTEKNGQLSHVAIDSTDSLLPNKWGVPEPVNGNYISQPGAQIIFVPMVAGDRFKNRIGYGKGYYDRFLTGNNAFKAGIMFNLQLVPDKIPVESFDVSLDCIITEKNTIK